MLNGFGIEKKSTEELIKNLYAGEYSWNKKYLVQAKEEVIKRGISESELQSLINKHEIWDLKNEEKLQNEYDEWIDSRKSESYTLRQILLLLLAGPMNLTEAFRWNFDSSFWGLISGKYYKMFWTRLLVISLSTFLYLWVANLLLDNA
jgi:hypothetical protein